jgi:acylphosphatase
METAARQRPAMYSTAVEGGAKVCVRYSISGHIEMTEYLDFVAERAGWLNIAGWAEATSAQSLTVVAAGPEALVGALEMALTLGPLTSLIDEVDATVEEGPVGPAFSVRSSPVSPAC